MSWKPIVTYIIRGAQSVFCIVVLGLSAGFWLMWDIITTVSLLPWWFPYSILSILVTFYYSCLLFSKLFTFGNHFSCRVHFLCVLSFSHGSNCSRYSFWKLWRLWQLLIGMQHPEGFNTIYFIQLVIVCY